MISLYYVVARRKHAQDIQTRERGFPRCFGYSKNEREKFVRRTDGILRRNPEYDVAKYYPKTDDVELIRMRPPTLFRIK